VADHHDHAAHVDLCHCIEHVKDHRAPAQEVQGLGALGPHARALSGGQNDS
jgi:hypothetical protein